MDLAQHFVIAYQHISESDIEESRFIIPNNLYTEFDDADAAFLRIVANSDIDVEFSIISILGSAINIVKSTTGIIEV